MPGKAEELIEPGRDSDPRTARGRRNPGRAVAASGDDLVILEIDREVAGEVRVAHPVARDPLEARPPVDADVAPVIAPIQQVPRVGQLHRYHPLPILRVDQLPAAVRP